MIVSRHNHSMSSNKDLLALASILRFFNASDMLLLNMSGPLHIAKVYYIEGYRNYDFRFLQTMFKIKIS